jgi:hypothetical protein
MIYPEIARKLFLKVGDEVLDASEEKDLPKIAHYLAVPNAVWNLASMANNGQGQAVVELIKAQPLEAQKAILAAPYAVAGLVFNGLEQAVVELIKAQPVENQRFIFYADGALPSLKRTLEQALKDIQEEWTSASRPALPQNAKHSPLPKHHF